LEVLLSQFPLSVVLTLIWQGRNPTQDLVRTSRPWKAFRELASMVLVAFPLEGSCRFSAAQRQRNLSLDWVQMTAGLCWAYHVPATTAL
jgi:hypothetical protein